MLFNSVQFILFFPITTILYFILPQKTRPILLLLASCLFYMAFIPAYILILFLTIIIDYFAGIMIAQSQGSLKRNYLIMSIISTCLVLMVFKYYNFFNTNFSLIASFLHWNYPVPALAIILPIGLSFHTFQSLAYIIEVYRGKQKAERNFLIYALYVMFFPQLVAGPIERPQNLLHQFYETHLFKYKRIADGLKLMAWGMFKKVVIADRLALFVNQAYNAPADFTGISLIVATIFFAFQIYCDFSGYSDIAIGAAQVMGFRLMDNFKRPYFAKSISEFWKRWHISLSSWFKDYFYISLGGNRVSIPRWYFNIFLTFLVSGLWHGANWTFIVWGALNGFYLIFGEITRPYREWLERQSGLLRFPRIYKHLQVITVFALTCFAWIFFRANNLSEALYIVTHLFSGLDIYAYSIFLGNNWIEPLLLGQNRSTFIIAVVSIAFLLYVHTIQRHGRIRHMLSEKPFWLRWAMYYLIVMGILCFGVFDNTRFIYFQF